MFTFGGILKLFGDLTALIGPLSITLIVEFIEMATIKQQPLEGPNRPSATLPRYTNSGSGVFPNGSINLNLQNSWSNLKFANNLNSNDSGAPLYYPGWHDFIANGWIMAGIVLFASLAQGTLSQASTHIVNMVGIRLRTSLQSLVYRKTLLISSSCFFAESAIPPTIDSKFPNEKGTTDTVTSVRSGMDNTCKRSATASIDGDGENQFIDTGTITNLMSDDTLNVMSFLWIAHYVWAIPLKVSSLLFLNLFTKLLFHLHCAEEKWYVEGLLMTYLLAN